MNILRKDMSWRNDKRFDVRHGWDLWLTEDAVMEIKKRWKGKAEVIVDRFNCGTINRVNIKPYKE